MEKKLYILGFILLFCTCFQAKAQLNITVSDTTVCNNNSFQVCATPPASALSGINLDDNFSSIINIGFTFKFMGTDYTQCVISDNNFISFNTTLAGALSNYDYNTALTSGQLNNAVLFPFQDLYVAGNSTGVIRYMTVGKAPNRKFIVEFCNVSYYNCTNLSSTNQLILYESSNIIEMHISNKEVCSTWPNGSQGRGVQGIRGASNANEYFVTGRGPTDPTWSASSDARRFSPTNTAGTSYSISAVTFAPIPFFTSTSGTFEWYRNNNSTPFASTNCVTVNPDTSDQYYVVKYTGAVGCQSTMTQSLYDTMLINYNVPTMPTTLNLCTNQLPYTWNGVSIPLGTTSQNNYDTVLVSAPNSCDTNFIVNLNISAPITPTFTQLGPYCSQSSINPLPQTSLEGVSGSWSPAINNNTTTTYTFTPFSGQCANSTTMTITINPSTTPIFNQVPPICVGGIFSLPATSSNGIGGTWSPVINNQATTTYTFTPSNGQCINNAYMTVVVNPPVTPLFTQLLAICIGDTFSLPNMSNNGISGTWSPALNNQSTTTYTFTPDSAECATTATMTVYVNNNTTPTFTQISAQCYASTFTLPTISNNMTTGTWSPAINNTTTTTYTFTPDTGQCATTTTMTVNITPQVVPTFTQIGPICYGQPLSFPGTSNNGISGVWSPPSNNTVSATYSFTPYPGQCASGTSMAITVLPATTPIFNQIDTICVGQSFTLPTTSLNGINGTWSPAINNQATTTYTFTPQASTQCTTTATMTVVVNSGTVPSFTQIGPLCIGSAFSLPATSNNGISGIWSPAINNAATTTYTFTPNVGQCAVSTNMTVMIQQVVIPNFPATDTLCQGISLTLPNTSPNGVNGNWSPAFNNNATTTYYFTPNAGLCAVADTMQVIILPNDTPTFTQIAPICFGDSFTLPTTSNNGIQGTWLPAINNTVTTTYTFTPKAGICANTTTMTVQVIPAVTPSFTQLPAICAGGSFTLPTTSNNGISGTWSPTVNNTATTTYTFTPSAGQCATTATMTVGVNNNTVPTFNQVAPKCAGTSFILPTTSVNGITGTWSPAVNNSATTTYTFTPSPGQCAVTTTMTVSILPNVLPVFTQVPAICAGGSFSLPGTSSNGISGTWSPAINNTATTTYTFTPNAGQCATAASMTVTVNPIVTPTFAQVQSICEGDSLAALPTTSLNGVSGTWSPAPNNSVTTTYTFSPASGTCAVNATMTIAVHPKTFGTHAAQICEGESYFFNGQSYASSNFTATDTLLNANGCDSIVTLNLTVVPVNPVQAAQELTGCGMVVFNGQTYTSSTTVVDTLLTVQGCDSMYRTTTVTVHPSYGIALKTDTFGCGRLVFEGMTYTESATLHDTFRTAQGCDSVYRLVNIVIDTFRLDATVFPSDPYENENVKISTFGNAPYDIISWAPSSSFPDQDAKEQQFLAQQPLTVVVTGQSLAGCRDTARVSFTVRPYRKDVRLPNAFSPNGDGRNDVFRPVLAIDRAYSLVDFRVFNRWGQALFATSNVNVGWDGTFNGKLMEQGVYYYMVTVVFMDGTKQTFKGDVTLIK